MRCAVELEQLVGYVPAHGLAHLALAFDHCWVPRRLSCGAGPASVGTILLDQIERVRGIVEALLRESEHHEFKLDLSCTVDLFEAEIARDASCSVRHGRHSRPRQGREKSDTKAAVFDLDSIGVARGDIGFIEKSFAPKTTRLLSGRLTPAAAGAAHPGWACGNLLPDSWSRRRCSSLSRMHRAAACAVGLAVLAQPPGCVRSRPGWVRSEHAGALGGQRLDLLKEGRDRAMKSKRGARGEGDLAERIAGVLKHVDRAQLVKLGGRQRQSSAPARRE